MSAIFGVVGTDGRPWAADDLDGVAGALAGLGPDGGGRWAGTAGRCGVAVGAALRHSSPEDRADSQPAQSAAGSVIAVGDVRLDNRSDLAPVLGLADAPTVPDSAFVLAGYERWGDEVLERLIGEFALAIVDRRRGGVLLARDHVGARPLALHRRRSVVAFASTALALAQMEGVGHTLDVRRAAEVLALVYVSDRTFVEGVRWLAPATALWIDDTGAREWTWWQPDPRGIVDLGSPAAHERELRDAFDVAVSSRLRTAGRVGAMTSGGLDSSSAAATAAQLLAPEPLPTYTSAPPPGWRAGERPQWDADESPLVRELAALHPNILPSFVHAPADRSFLDIQEPMWELGAPPMRNPCNQLWLHAIVERAGGDGITTLLNGARGNLAFSADSPEWLATLIRAGRFRAAARETRAWARVTAEGPLRTAAARIIYQLLPPAGRRLVRRAAGRGSVAADWIASTALRAEHMAEVDPVRRVPAIDERRPPDPRELALWIIQAGATQAEAQSALAALTGVEQRDPTVDRRVLAAAIRQPDWVRRHDGQTRAVVRGAMADRLPPAIATRTRRGEQLPDWLDLMTAARQELATELSAIREHPTSRELIDVPRLETLMGRWPERTQRADPAVVRDYRLALMRALVVSRYLRWFESRAGAATTATSRPGAPVG